jgi:hypothetical protein
MLDKLSEQVKGMVTATSPNGQERLLPQHLADLRKSGLSDQTIYRCGFCSEKDADKIRSLLNWTGRGPLGAALVIPYFDADGKPTNYARLKLDSPICDKTDGKPRKYEAPRGASPLAYFSAGGVTAAALADPDEAVLLTEGEKKAAKADEAGFACIGLSGVWSWTKKRQGQGPRELLDGLGCLPWEGRRVYIVFDSDAADKENVRQAEAELARVLGERGAIVSVVRLPAAADGAKVGLDDFLLSNPPEALRKLLATPAETTPAEPAAAAAVPGWPAQPLAEAFYGLAGDIVRTLEPHTEADPAGILLQTLVGFGSVIGRKAYAVVEADRHYGNEFLVLIGKTAKGRKGTSWGRTESLLRYADEGWAAHQILSGLSSAEGLVWHVRDPIKKQERTRKRGEAVSYQEVEADPGASDKRLLVFEPEFANVLKQAERQGNTLSAYIRQAWDCGNLGTLVKNNPTRATGAHISLIAHVTADELRRYLTATEQANGFANRHLWACVKRSKELPEGGRLDDATLTPLRMRLANALRACRPGEINRDDDARAIWRGVYSDLSAERPGLTGALLGRAEAHVLRLSLLYALMDSSLIIRAPHLMAAIALWDYCEASVRYVFGDSLGDPVADELLQELRRRSRGMSRTEIRDLFQRNASAERIVRALALLRENGLAGLAPCQTSETGGRPAERWFATRK